MRTIALFGIITNFAVMLIAMFIPTAQPVTELGKPYTHLETAQQVSERVPKTVSKKSPIIPKSSNKNVNKTVKSSSQARWLADLRACESTSNYRANTGNGFYGAYQFMISTWNRIAPMVGRPDLIGVRPDLASPADQDFMIVQNTKLSAGGLATQNPGCYKKLGLSQFPPN